MTEEFKEILDVGENDTVEFKSWINARNVKEIISLAVDELIAFANNKGGTVLQRQFIIGLFPHYLLKYQISSMKENLLLQYRSKQMERHIQLQMADA